FNFYPRSPRYISAEAAGAIVSELPDVIKVGVFVNETPERISEIARIARLDAVQLHGDESPAFVKYLADSVSCSVIKAFRVAPEFDARSVLDNELDAVLLDGYSGGVYGGAGETFDWDIAKSISPSIQLYLAGGLSAANVRAAISEVRPYAVDSCSLLESSPGKKDPEKLRRFITEAKRND
ncbi:MAG: phosphoribosylanthranilate isomerase, partial [Blastocatellia bacterium]|nr:phosphoribosylanthranilate isomerase [Blastocatellia bacterium]